MLTREYILGKINSMSDEIVEEVGDFIDFLEARRGHQQIYRRRVEEEAGSLTESDMSSYLSELTAYEEMLSKGEIEWR